MDDAMVRRGHLGPKKEGSRMGIFILAFLAFLCSLFSVGCAEAAGFEKSVEWRALVVSEGPRSGLGIAPIVRRLSREGYEVDVRTAAGAQRQGHRADLMRWGKRVYGKVALLAPTASNLPEGSSVHSLRRFFDAGGDLLLALTPDSPEHTRDLASSMGADPFPPGSLYGNGSAKGMSQHLDWASELLAGRPGLIGESVDVTDALPLATSPESSTASPVLPADDHVCPLGACGRASTPMVAVEGRNGARAIVVGHPSLLSPRLPLAERAIAWAFHEANSFRLKSFLHWHAGSGGGAFLNPPNYKVQDSVVSRFCAFMLVLGGSTGSKPAGALSERAGGSKPCEMEAGGPRGACID